MDTASQLGQARQVLSFVWNHPANRGNRIRSVARAARFQIRGRTGRPTVTRVGRRCRMYVWLHDHASAKALYANPPDWNEMSAWHRLLLPGELFVDVGSNVGSYTLWAADIGADVIAIEPNHAAADKLRANIELNQLAVKVHRCALGSEPGWMWLTSDYGTMNHLLFQESASTDKVPVDTLDNLLGDRYAAGVKIDVEGAERLVLEGARRALAAHRIGVLQLEWNRMSQQVLDEDRTPVARILSTHGYRLARPDGDGILRKVSTPVFSHDDMFAVSPARADELGLRP